MVRKALIAAVAALALAAGAGPRIERSFMAFQTDTTDEAPAATLELSLGETLTFFNADLTVDDVTLEPAFDDPAFTDVRVSLEMTNTGAEPIPYSGVSFLSDPTFPSLVLRDGDGTIRGIDVFHLARTSVPGAYLNEIQPGLGARWVIGFRVPAASDSPLELQASAAGQTLATWNLESAAAPASVDPPVVDTVSVDGSLSWSDTVSVTPRELGELVCGDPAIEPIMHIVTVTFDVTNNGTEFAEWPGILEPSTPAVIQWADGSAAEFAFETFVGDAETLQRVSGRSSLIPPGTTQERAMVFASPRDARFVDVTDLPLGALLFPSSGPRVWLDLADVEATIGVSPEMCYLGFTAGASPYSFMPPATFTPLPADEAAVAAAQLLTAGRLLDLAIAGAALYYDANGQTFARMTAADLAAFTPGIDTVSYDVTTELTNAVGVVYFDTDPTRTDFLFVMTQTPSGTWVCDGIQARGASIRGQDSTSLDAAKSCWPEAFEEPEA